MIQRDIQLLPFTVAELVRLSPRTARHELAQWLHAGTDVMLS